MKNQVIRAGLELCRRQLIARTWGNVSIRTDENHFAITASGKEYSELTEKDIVELDIETLEYEGDVKPSGEEKIHQQIYKLKPDANFVIHTHQHNASAVAAMGLPAIKIPDEYPELGRVIPCAAYGLPGTKKITENFAKVLKESDCKAILMANHGAVCYGADYNEAMSVALSLEAACGAVLEAFGVEPWDEVSSCDFVPACACGTMVAHLDDFAQMFGRKLPLKTYEPMRIADKYGEDVDAVMMVIEKNCRAAQAAAKANGKPLGAVDCALMRAVYKNKYSKLKK